MTVDFRNLCTLIKMRPYTCERSFSNRREREGQWAGLVWENAANHKKTSYNNLFLSEVAALPRRGPSARVYCCFCERADTFWARALRSFSTFCERGSMLLTVLSWLCCCCCCLLLSASGGTLPEAEVTVEVMHRPFLCHRKSKYGDIMLVHHEGYFENGTMFHSRYVS